MVPQIVQSDSALAELFERWDRRAAQYGDVLCGSSFSRKGESWRNVMTFFSPLQRGTELQPLHVDYGDLLIVRNSVTLVEAKSALTKLVQSGCLTLPGRPDVELSIAPQPALIRRHGSHSLYGPRFGTGYATIEYPFQFTGVPDGQVVSGPVCSLTAPLYPHAYAAIQDLLSVRLPNQGTSELIALAPDYRARVQNVDLSDSSITVTIDAFENDTANIVGKIYHEDMEGRVHHGDLVFQDGIARFKAKGDARRIMVLLLSRAESDVIDEWVYDPHAGATAGAAFQTPMEDWESLVLAGESETVEFKSKPDGLALAIEISAFANTHGGRILVGVTDEAEVEGCDPGKTQDTITRSTDARCEPKPRFAVSAVSIREKPVVIITVPEGTEKPYSIREKGVYVRSGATRRQATRVELDGMYPARPPQVIPWR